MAKNCKKSTKPPPYTHWQAQQAKRSVYATLQYLGIETSIKFLSLYARHYDFTQEEYDHLGQNLIGNYCSPNITTMSHSTLKKKWIASFYHPLDKFPHKEGRELFQYFSPLSVDKEKARKKEFALTVELFKSFCSWGNDPDDLRLLVPLVRNPAIMAFAFRHLTHTKLEWHEKAGELLYRRDADGSSISCQNLICRRSHRKIFVLKELGQLYCRHFRDVDYKKGKGVPPKIQKIIATTSETESQLMASHFISLLTGTPDFFLYAEKFSDMARFARIPMELLWKKWVLSNKQTIDPVFSYEEQLSLEPVPLSRGEEPLKIALQVNFGEWDRATYLLGKIKKSAHLGIFNNVLAYAQKIQRTAPNQTTAYLKKMLHQEMIRIHSLLSPPVTTGVWSEMVVRQLSAYIRQKKGPFRFDNSHTKTLVPIELYYAPFALQHLLSQRTPP